MNVAYIFLLQAIMFFSAQSSKILGVFPSPGYSQFILAEKLMVELVKRGHQVTVISAFKPKVDVKNYTAILIDGIIETLSVDMYKESQNNAFESLKSIEDYGQIITEYLLAHEKVQRLINSNETFDLVIVELIMNEAHMAFATHFRVPLVTFHSMSLMEWVSRVIGNVRPPSVNPMLYSYFTDRMMFLERLQNTLLAWFYVFLKEFVYLPNQQKMLNKYFPGDISIKDIQYNSSIILLNSHPTTVYPSTLTSSVIEIGGFHISPKKLPDNIQKYLDESTEGAIFFSMGSNVKSSQFSQDMLNGILNSFSKLKQRVLWKYEDTDIPNTPNNVLSSKWMPQSDILAHPNVVAFITHGGLLSTTEAIYHGVPMIGIPILFDQHMNVALSVQKQIAVRIKLPELSEESLSSALREILYNPKYSKNVKELSKIFKDQLVQPMDVAMFWIEYVLRYGGAPHLRSATTDLYWFQLYMVDVVFFLVGCILLIFYALRRICRTNIHLYRNYKEKTN